MHLAGFELKSFMATDSEDKVVILQLTNLTYEMSLGGANLHNLAFRTIRFTSDAIFRETRKYAFSLYN